MRVRYSQFFVLFAVFFLSACAAEYPRLNIVEPLPAELTCRVALLPFVNHGELVRGEDIFKKVFATELQNIAGLDVIPDGDVQNLYQQLRMYPQNLPKAYQMQIIGNRLDAQLIILGEIIDMAEVDTGNYVDTRITVSVRIHEASSGNLLWSTYHRRKGEEYRNIMHYGRVNTITGLSRRMADEIITMWTKEGLNQCNAR